MKTDHESHENEPSTASKWTISHMKRTWQPLVDTQGHDLILSFEFILSI